MNQKNPISLGRRILMPLVVLAAGAIIGFFQLVLGFQFTNVSWMNPFAIVFVDYPILVAVLGFAGLVARGTRWQQYFLVAMWLAIVADAAMVMTFFMMLGGH